MRPHEAASAPALGAALRQSRERIRDALDHYTIGYDSRGWGLPVDWEHVADRMAQALAWEGGTWASALPAPRDFTREPEDDDSDPELTARMGDED